MGFDKRQDSHEEYVDGLNASLPPTEPDNMPESRLFLSAWCLSGSENLFVRPMHRRCTMMESSVMCLVVHSQTAASEWGLFCFFQRSSKAQS
jgi:hypothetical protein